MHAVTIGLNNFNDLSLGMSGTPPHNPASPSTIDPAQLQQLVQLLGANQQSRAASLTAQAPSLPAAGPPKQTAVVECPKSMVGRVIGKGGETIKALQQYTGAMIQIDQSTDPTRVTIAGSSQSLQLAVSMVNDIVRGTFKGFAMLRQIAVGSGPVMPPFGQPQPVYIQGYGFVPPSQVFSPEEAFSTSTSLLRTSPRGPLTPPITPLRANAPNTLAGALPPETLAALLGASSAPIGPQGMLGVGPSLQQASQQASQDALLAHLLNQLAVQQQGSAPNLQTHAMTPTVGLEQGAIQTMLAHAGLMGAGQAYTAAAAGATPGIAQSLTSGPSQHLPPATNLMLSAHGTPALLGSNGQSALDTSGAAGGLGQGLQANTKTIGEEKQGGTLSTGSVSPAQSLASVPSTSAPLHSGAGWFGAGSPPPSHMGGSLSGFAHMQAASGSAGSGRGSPTVSPTITGLSAAANPSLAHRQTSGESSPLGRYGAIGTGVVRSDEEDDVDNAGLTAKRSLPPFPTDSPWGALLQ